jgi:hypothetical protein
VTRAAGTAQVVLSILMAVISLVRLFGCVHEEHVCIIPSHLPAPTRGWIPMRVGGPPTRGRYTI